MFNNLLNRGLTGGDTDPMLQQAFFEAPNGCIQPLVYPCLRFLRDKPLLALDSGDADLAKQEGRQFLAPFGRCFLCFHSSVLFVNFPPAEDVFVVNADTCPINTPLIFATP